MIPWKHMSLKQSDNQEPHDSWLSMYSVLFIRLILLISCSQLSNYNILKQTIDWIMCLRMQHNMTIKNLAVNHLSADGTSYRAANKNHSRTAF